MVRCGPGFSRAKKVAQSVRGVFRSTWFSALMVAWYALVAMPALPALRFAPRLAQDASCVTVCTCASCKGGDACCCAETTPGDSASPASQSQDDGLPAWRPVDCSTSASWITGHKAPTITSSNAIEELAQNPIARLLVIDEQAMPTQAIGVPEPPPRTAA